MQSLPGGIEIGSIAYTDLESALRCCGANWNAAQAHGLLCGRLTLRGSAAVAEWLAVVLEGSEADAALRAECSRRLEAVSADTERRLAERQSLFTPLLPDDTMPAAMRTDALAHWCEGYLHGLVSTRHAEDLKRRLAGEPLADIIRDMLEITRATVDPRSPDEADEQAYAELVEYVRVAAQLAYEELADLRPAAGDAGGSASLH